VLRVCGALRAHLPRSLSLTDLPMTAVKTISALLLTLALGALPAYAQNIDISVGGGVDANTGDTTSVDADAEVEADAEVSTDDTETDAATNTATGFTLTRTDASVTNSSGTPMSADSVNTESDLEVFAATTLRTNDSFEGVDVASDRLSFRFKEDAKLFGFIPHQVTSRVVVSGDGRVEISRPWYSFLASGLSADTATSIESRVRTALGESAGSMNTRTQALVLAEIASALAGSVDVSADTTNSAELQSDETGINSAVTGDTSAAVDVVPN